MQIVFISILYQSLILIQVYNIIKIYEMINNSPWTGLYDRIKKHVRLAKINKKISPHNLRHSFATDMLNRKVNIVTIQKILGHRCITSTIRYLRITINDLRDAISKHPVNEFSDVLDKYLPNVRLPYQLSRSGFK